MKKNSLQKLIKEFRKDSTNTQKYGFILAEIARMFNEGETLNIAGTILDVNDAGLKNTYISKSLGDENYILLFTDDSKTLNKVLKGKKTILSIKIPALFNILFSDNSYSGFILNDGDGKGNVLLRKDVIEKAFKQKK